MQHAAFSPDTLKKHAPVLASLTLTLGLVALNSYLFFLLVRRVQDNKTEGYEGQDSLPLLIVSFAASMLATTTKLAYTVYWSQEYRGLEEATLAEERGVITDRYVKALRHDATVTIIKLGTGAFGWQLAFMLAQYGAGYEYDADFTHESAIPTMIIWPATGIGAAIFLNVGMLASQKCLSHVDDEAMSASRLFFLALQLSVSVFMADGLWLFATNSASILSAVFNQLVLQKGAELVFAAIFYLAESFLFKVGHNALNHWHPDNGYSHKFVCDNRFVGVLWSAYFGFKFCVDGITALLKLSTGWAPKQFAPVDVIVACVIAAIGTMILPIIYGWGDYVECLEQQKKNVLMAPEDIESGAAALRANESFETIQCDDSASDVTRSLLGSVTEATTRTGQLLCFNRACVLFKRGVDTLVQFAADTCPRSP